MATRRSNRKNLLHQVESISKDEEKENQGKVGEKHKSANTDSKGPAYKRQFKSKGQYTKGEREGGSFKDSQSAPSKSVSESLKCVVTPTISRYPMIPPLGDKFVGAHVSAAGGLHNAIDNALNIGCRSFALFVRNQRTWVKKPLEEDEVNKFKKKLADSNFPVDQIVPHGSYLLNCGSSNESIFQKSRETLLDEVSRCELLGLKFYNFHPGSTCGVISIPECIKRIAQCINEALRQTQVVTILLENMSRQGNTVGGYFEELRSIIDLVEDQSRIGICLDTCHAFASGYDISTKDGFETTLSELDKIIGMRYLKALHLNDSKGELACRKDRHEDIGKGKIGANGFEYIMNDPRLRGIPMVLETPGFNDYDKQIKLLYSYVTN